MSKTRDAVEEFMRLGAKYEVVLVGIANELVNQESKLMTVQSESKKMLDQSDRFLKDANQAIEGFRNLFEEQKASINKVEVEVAELRKSVDDLKKTSKNLILAVVGVAGLALAIVIAL
jgi:hypothetical protein